MSTQIKIDTAKPVFRRTRRSDPGMVEATRSLLPVLQGSPDWTANPACTAASAALSSAADAIEANAKSLVDLRSKLTAMIAAQHVNRRNWRIAAQHVLANAAVLAQGSADQVRALGFDVQVRATPGSSGPPVDLATRPGRELGEAIVTWARGGARRGFVVQHASDPASPASFSTPVPCTRATWTLSGAPPSSTVYFRVAAIDPAAPHGLTAWSDWIAGTVR